MGYNSLNYLRKCKIVNDIVQSHYKAGITTYSGIFPMFVKHFYPMDYKSFMKMVNMRYLDKQIKEEEDCIGKADDKQGDGNVPANQLNLF